MKQKAICRVGVAYIAQVWRLLSSRFGENVPGTTLPPKREGRATPNMPLQESVRVFSNLTIKRAQQLVFFF